MRGTAARRHSEIPHCHIRHQRCASGKRCPAPPKPGPRVHPPCCPDGATLFAHHAALDALSGLCHGSHVVKQATEFGCSASGGGAPSACRPASPVHRVVQTRGQVVQTSHRERSPRAVRRLSRGHEARTCAWLRGHLPKDTGSCLSSHAPRWVGRHDGHEMLTCLPVPTYFCLKSRSRVVAETSPNVLVVVAKMAMFGVTPRPGRRLAVDMTSVAWLVEICNVEKECHVRPHGMRPGPRASPPFPSPTHLGGREAANPLNRVTPTPFGLSCLVARATTIPEAPTQAPSPKHKPQRGRRCRWPAPASSFCTPIPLRYQISCLCRGHATAGHFSICQLPHSGHPLSHSGFLLATRFSFSPSL